MDADLKTQAGAVTAHVGRLSVRCEPARLEGRDRVRLTLLSDGKPMRVLEWDGMRVDPPGR